MAAKLKFELDANLVRGLDYYTKTAFEIQYTPLGAQSALCGGGRYDGLVEQIGGPATPGIGFAMGIERVLLALEKQGSLPFSHNFVDVFIVSTEAKHRDLAFNMLKQFRNLGLKTEIDFIGRSLKAQMKQANRLNARHSIILGDEEVARGTVVLRDMRTSEQNEVNIDGISKLLCKTEVRENE
jgi:histidyl-tRNA synthetase